MKQAGAVSDSKRSADPSSTANSTSAASTFVSSTSPLVVAASEWKQEGNAAFAAQDYARALVAYNQGLHVLQDGPIIIQTASERSVSADDAETATAADTLKQLNIQLYSNRAMVYIRTCEFERAERDCSVILDDFDHKTISKVWYRRAQAREGLAKSGRCDNPEHYLLLAKEDLQKSLKFGPLSPENNMETVKRVVASLAMRIQRSLTALQQQQRAATSGNRGTPQQQQQQKQNVIAANGGSTASNSIMSVAVSPSPQRPPMQPPPSPEEQRRCVMDLLINEYGVLSEGQAFYLMDWDWWCEWCHHVGFYANDKNNHGNRLKYMPPGAVLAEELEPAEEEDDDGGSSDDEVDVSAESSSTSPGPIDNASLLLPPQEQKLKDVVSSRTLFYRHWYQAYYSNDALALKPGLVRGHHYEILPREVYHALKEWYGEVTPPIGRRLMAKSNDLKLHLYDVLTSSSSQHRPTTTLPEGTVAAPCSACGAPVATMRCRRCMCVHYCDRTCQEGHWPSHKS